MYVGMRQNKGRKLRAGLAPSKTTRDLRAAAAARLITIIEHRLRKIPIERRHTVLQQRGVKSSDCLVSLDRYFRWRIATNPLEKTIIRVTDSQCRNVTYAEENHIADEAVTKTGKQPSHRVARL